LDTMEPATYFATYSAVIATFGYYSCAQQMMLLKYLFLEGLEIV
uniref:Proton_antipo_M domain-containing protein n=1 Tax=Angiostrongylus cantonensis TaxID=6313 RepID=A0A0K0DPQ1_ANGCA